MDPTAEELHHPLTSMAGIPFYFSIRALSKLDFESKPA
jgi:hypothetical protein